MEESKDVCIDLGFQSLSYVVKLKAKKGQPEAPTSKTIISEASGVCHAKRLLAIMGPSGAGKTSLLDILAGRKAQSEGYLSLNGGRSATPTEIQRCAAYVQQDDAIMSTQTAREAIVMAALLTLPRTMSYKDKLGRADSIMKTFHLEGCADTLVGDPVGKVKGLSGGERKRCAVAMSAIRNPKILFLDEPTSGLDAFKALTLIQVLKTMAGAEQSTVICTIHQPSSDIFSIFDDLMLLFSGRIVFQGAASQAVQYFARVGYACPQYANPADFFFMHVLRNDAESRFDQLVKAWTDSTEFTSMNGSVEDLLKRSSQPLKGAVLGPNWQITSSTWTQFVVLFRRGFNDVKRNALRGKAFIGQSIAMGIILSLIWFQVSDDQNGVQDRAGVLFFITTNGMMQNVMGVLTTFSSERGAVLREQENAIVTLLAQAGNSMGLFLACIFPDVSIALAVAPLVILPLIMFSGFVLNPESIPVYLCWVEWLSPTKYAFAALAQVEFDDLSLHCTADQIKRVVTEEDTIANVCDVTSGEMYLDRLNIQDILTISNCAIFLVIILVAFQVLAFLGLVWITHRTKAKARAS